MKIFKAIILFLTLTMLFATAAMAAPAVKQRVAVLEFEDQTQYSYWGAGRGIADIITTKLLNTGKYDIIERQRLNDILAEQGLSLNGILDGSTAVKSKMIKGVEVLIFGSVTKFNVKDQSVGIGRFRVGKSDAEVEVQLRMVDATSGSILMAETAYAKTSVPQVEVWGRVNLDFNSSNFQASALGKATNKCADDLVEKITGKLAQQVVKPAAATEGYVILDKNGSIYIDLGRNAVSTEQKFTVFRQGESIIHPITKAVIPGSLKKVGVITVIETQDNLSICKIDSVVNGEKIQVGDIIRLNE